MTHSKNPQNFSVVSFSWQNPIHWIFCFCLFVFFFYREWNQVPSFVFQGVMTKKLQNYRDSTSVDTILLSNQGNCTCNLARMCRVDGNRLLEIYLETCAPGKVVKFEFPSTVLNSHVLTTPCYAQHSIE